MSRLNLDIAPSQVIWPRVVMVGGLGLVFAPLNVAAYIYIPRALRGAAVGLLALLRNEGGSVGTSLGQTITERREQFHVLRLGEYLDPLNPAVTSFLAQAQPGLPPANRRPGGRAADGPAIAWDLRDQQASALSYFDCFLIFAVVSVILAFLVLFMKRSVAEKGAHVAAE